MTTPITVVGNLVADPELRFSASGSAIAKLRLASNTRKRAKDGTYEDGDPTYWRVTAFGVMAENIGESLTKGCRVVVVGRVQMTTWETQSGEKRSDYEVVAESVGPDLRWATAIPKPQKGSRGGGFQAVEDPWANRPSTDEVPF